MKKFLKLISLIIIFLILIYLGNEIIKKTSLNRFKEEIKINDPLVKEVKEGETVSLSSSGILKWTNYEREQYQLDSLSLDNNLNIIAEIKINEMFEKQYFDHFSPSGEAIAEVADRVGYSYIGIGENLAMGGFKDDRDLVNGWMNSPGHRANILKSGYKEIGISTKEGIFNGKNVWLAVQVFALPSSACPNPDYRLLSEINEKNNEAEEIYLRINQIKKDLDSSRAFNRKKIEEHNDLVLKYNNLLNEIKELTDTYNIQVNSMNNCINNYGF